MTTRLARSNSGASTRRSFRRPLASCRAQRSASSSLLPASPCHTQRRGRCCSWRTSRTSWASNPFSMLLCTRSVWPSCVVPAIGTTRSLARWSGRRPWRAIPLALSWRPSASASSLVSSEYLVRRAAAGRSSQWSRCNTWVRRLKCSWRSIDVEFRRCHDQRGTGLLEEQCFRKKCMIMRISTPSLPMKISYSLALTCSSPLNRSRWREGKVPRNPWELGKKKNKSSVRCLVEGSVYLKGYGLGRNDTNNAGGKAHRK